MCPVGILWLNLQKPITNSKRCEFNYATQIPSGVICCMVEERVSPRSHGVLNENDSWESAPVTFDYCRRCCCCWCWFELSYFLITQPVSEYMLTVIRSFGCWFVGCLFTNAQSYKSNWIRGQYQRLNRWMNWVAIQRDLVTAWIPIRPNRVQWWMGCIIDEWHCKRMYA